MSERDDGIDQGPTVRHDDRMVLRTHIALYPLAGQASSDNLVSWRVKGWFKRRGPMINVASSPVTSNKADGLDIRMVTYGVNRVDASMDDVENAGRQSYKENQPKSETVRPFKVLPARSQSSAIIIAAPGSRSEGFRMRVLPVTVARGIVHKGIILEDQNQKS